jgi:hypothetical protein
MDLRYGITRTEPIGTFKFDGTSRNFKKSKCVPTTLFSADLHDLISLIRGNLLAFRAFLLFPNND